MKDETANLKKINKEINTFNKLIYEKNNWISLQQTDLHKYTHAQTYISIPIERLT